MADRIVAECDPAPLLAALDQLGDVAERLLDEVCADTAERIKAEAKARLSRQTHGTGATARAIVADRERRRATGSYRVYVAPVPGRAANLPVWLEFGTRHARAFPFLTPAARLESGPHRRRVEDALLRAVRERR